MKILDYTDMLHDFADNAALLANLDDAGRDAGAKARPAIGTRQGQ